MARIRVERVLPYPPAAVFDLVADIEQYPEFVPGCRDARILARKDDVLTVEQELGVRGWSWRFRTHARLERPHRITITTREPPFRHLHQVWSFADAGHGETRAVLEVDYALRNPIVSSLASALFEEGFRRTLAAFEERAHRRLG